MTSDFQFLEDESTKLLRNVGNKLSSVAVSHPRRTQSSPISFVFQNIGVTDG
jgi:hypothetical protein